MGGITRAATLDKILRAGTAYTPLVFQGSETRLPMNWEAIVRLQDVMCGLSEEVPGQEAFVVEIIMVFYPSAACLSTHSPACQNKNKREQLLNNSNCKK